MEWLYHIGVPVDQIEELATNSANTVPVMMPYIDAFFMPRLRRPPEGRTRRLRELRLPRPVRRDPARYHLHHRIFHANRHGGCPYAARRGPRRTGGLGQVSDVRDLLNATVKLRDGKARDGYEAESRGKMVLKKALEKIAGTDVEKAPEGVSRYLSRQNKNGRAFLPGGKRGEALCLSRLFFLNCGLGQDQSGIALDGIVDRPETRKDEQAAAAVVLEQLHIGRERQIL